MKDKISIITYTYNNEDIVLKSINSVLNQTFNNIELIIIDNHSSDNTYKIIKKIKDNRLKVIRLRKKIDNKYLYNLALKEISGKYINFLNINNLYRFDKLDKQLNNIVNNDSDIDICKSIIHNDNITILNNNIFNELNNNNLINLDCLLIRKSIISRIKFDEELDSLEDLDYILRISNHKISYSNEILIDIYKDKEISNKKDIIRIIKKDYKIDDNNKDILENYLLRNLYDNKLNNLLIKYNDLNNKYLDKEKELNNITNNKKFKFINKIIKVIRK